MKFSGHAALLILHRHPLFNLLLIAVLGSCAYANTFHVPFVFDDSTITNNPQIKNLSRFITIDALAGSRYIGNFTFALNYALHGQAVWGYHLGNLLIHLANAALVCILLRQTLHAPFFSAHEPGTGAERVNEPAPLLAALLFVAHPLQTQAVTYVVQRYTSLATFFYLLAMVAYGRGRLQAGIGKRPAAGWYVLALAATICAMKTKEIAFTLPFALLLYEGLFFSGTWRSRFLRLGPFFGMAALVPLSVLASPKLIGVKLGNERVIASDLQELNRWDYLCTQFKVIVTYLRLLFLPIDQQFDYDYPIAHSFWQVDVVAAFLLLLALFSAALWLIRQTSGREAPLSGVWRLAAFGILFFFLALAVESSVLPIVDVIYEHRLYLPSVGFALTVPMLLLHFWRNTGAIWFLGLTILLLAGITYNRNLVWKDEESLWLDNLRKSPGKARIHGNLATVYKNRNDHRRALEAFNKMLDCDPNFAIGYNNRGSFFLNQIGRYDLAVKDFRRALALDPSLIHARVNLGNAYDYLGDSTRALAEYNLAIDQDPNFANAYYDRGIFFRRQGKEAQARADFTRAEEIDAAR